MAAVGDVRPYREIVFCGYGEPLLRLETVLEVACRLKRHGARVRVDTNGQAGLIYGRNVVPELVGLVDVVSISLNAHTPELYLRLCRPRFQEAAYPAMLEFGRECVRLLPEVVLTVVEFGPVDVEACRRIAEGLGAGFRVRRHRPGV